MGGRRRRFYLLDTGDAHGGHDLVGLLLEMVEAPVVKLDQGSEVTTDGKRAFVLYRILRSTISFACDVGCGRTLRIERTSLSHFGSR